MEKSETTADTKDVLEQGLKSLEVLGRTWAVHGLSIGRQALDATARTLKLTAEMLDTVRDGIETNREPG